MKKKYEHAHIVCFEETNVMGNVYFASFIQWQGRCRELFIREKAHELLYEMEKGDLVLITLHCACSYLSELKVFDEVVIAMGLDDIQQNRIRISFEYSRKEQGSYRVVAKGVHEAGCFRRGVNGLQAIPVPPVLANALKAYQ